MTNDSNGFNVAQRLKEFPEVYFRGIGQVMFQDSPVTGILFLAGIFWGAYAGHLPLVGWGAVVGTLASTMTGYALGLKDTNGSQGLWGFNGALVGCAFPTFLDSTVWMWIALVICASMTTWVRSGLDRILGKFRVSSLTFPFVLTTWIFLLASREFSGMPPTHMAIPVLEFGGSATLGLSFGDLVVYWLKGMSQVFLIDNWVTGIIFLVALACCSPRAAIWAAIASALSLFAAVVMGAPGESIANGLYGFSAVLTGIALGATFCNHSWRSVIWTLVGIVATVFVQAAMNAFLTPVGLATLTGPFCITTWIFLLPGYRKFSINK